MIKLHIKTILIVNLLYTPYLFVTDPLKVEYIVE